jgi:hypothetical protein
VVETLPPQWCRLRQKFKKENFIVKPGNPLRSFLLFASLVSLAFWSVLVGPAQTLELRIATSYKLMTLDPANASQTSDLTNELSSCAANVTPSPVS